MKLEELLEKETIKEVRIKYSHYFDSKQVDDLVGLFTEDAVCEFGPDYGCDWTVKEQIRKNFAKRPSFGGTGEAELELELQKATHQYLVKQIGRKPKTSKEALEATVK